MRPSPVPTEAGIYGWYFDQLPGDIDAHDCCSAHGLRLLYVGIAPARPPKPGEKLRRHLRVRIMSHFRGNADASTLRLTLGSLLRQELGIRLSFTPGGRLTFGTEGERRLTEWMAQHAFATWSADPEPWILEDSLIASLSLPLNLRGNTTHPNWARLAAERAAARAEASRP